MAFFNLQCLSIVVLLCIVSFQLDLINATQYTVGGSPGWNVGVDYKSWASQHSFKIGDALEFKYDNGVHSISQVSEADFKACSSANAITTSSIGNTIVKLDKAQTYYFICGVQSHCQSGMQLSVHVGQTTTSTSSTSPTSSLTTPTNSSTSPQSNSEATISSSFNQHPCIVFSILMIPILFLINKIF